uniref:Uncharacterized protein n=1 Tax=Octopus bimaculoides TaxID=37653 RepID=A0A0L8IFF0_OCTBM
MCCIVFLPLLPLILLQFQYLWISKLHTATPKPIQCKLPFFISLLIHLTL